MDYRIEKDTMGDVNVPADKYWGAQTERSRNNFKIGVDRSKMPLEIVHAFAHLKKAAAFTNHELEVLSEEKRDLIGQVCDEILNDVVLSKLEELGLTEDDDAISDKCQSIDGELDQSDHAHLSTDVLSVATFFSATFFSSVATGFSFLVASWLTCTTLVFSFVSADTISVCNSFFSGSVLK